MFCMLKVLRCFYSDRFLWKIKTLKIDYLIQQNLQWIVAMSLTMILYSN